MTPKKYGPRKVFPSTFSLTLCLVVIRGREEKGKEREKGKRKERKGKLVFLDVFGYKKERKEFPI